MRSEIGDLFYTDIDVGITPKSLELLENHYQNHKVNVSLYLKKARDDL